MIKNNEYNIHDKISIIIPIYRVENYLRKCLDSVVKQTYRNLEIILVDDGSDDGCPAICDEYASYDDRIIVIHNKNGGLSNARNAGIDIATGSYIGFVDSDDWIELDMYEVLYKKAILYNADIVMCGHYIVQDNKLHISYISYEDKKYSTEEALLNLIEDRNVNNYAWGKLYKRELFEDARYPNGYNFEDIATTYKLLALSKSIIRISDIKYYYVQRMNSITNQDSIKNRYDLFVAFNQRYNDLSDSLQPCCFKLFYSTVIVALKSYIHWIIKKQKIRKNNLFIKSDLRKNFRKYRKKHNYKDLKMTVKLAIFFSLINSVLFENIVRIIFKFYNNNKKMYNLLNIFAGILDNKYLFANRAYDSSIYLIGTPEHNNLGDHAIAYAERQYLKDNFPNNNVIEISDEKFYYYLYSLKRSIKKSDIIIIHGGGNIGNQYQYYEDIRRKTIKSFHKNRIFIFPQTIYFSNDDTGNKQFEVSKRIYQKHKQLTIIAREQISYYIMKKHFYKNTILLAPDIVMCLKHINPKVKKRGALLCFRDDIEGIIEDKEIQLIRKEASKYYHKITETDTCMTRDIKKDERNIVLEAKLYQFDQAELVITDRLHGMIFAAITETPCICLGNYNHKVEGTYKWIEQLPYIKYLNSLDELESTIDILRNLNSEEIIYDNTFTHEYYEKIIEAILQDYTINQITEKKLIDLYSSCHCTYKSESTRKETV